MQHLQVKDAGHLSSLPVPSSIAQNDKFWGKGTKRRSEDREWRWGQHFQDVFDLAASGVSCRTRKAFTLTGTAHLSCSRGT